MEKTSALPASHAAASHAKSKLATAPAGGDGPTNSFSGVLAAMGQDAGELVDASGDACAVQQPLNATEQPAGGLAAGMLMPVADAVLPVPLSAPFPALSPSEPPLANLVFNATQGVSASTLVVPQVVESYGLRGVGAVGQLAQVGPVHLPPASSSTLPSAAVPNFGTSALRPAVGASSQPINPLAGAHGGGKTINSATVDTGLIAILPVAVDVTVKAASSNPAPEVLGNLLAQMKVSGGNSFGSGAPSDASTAALGAAGVSAKLARGTGLSVEGSKITAAALGTSAGASLEKRGMQYTDMLQEVDGALAEARAATQISGLDAASSMGRLAHEFHEEALSKSLDKTLGGDASQNFSARFESINSTQAIATGDTATLAPGELLSQQLQYWVNQKSQSAELTLDAGTANPVEVSITLTGNEAQVVFRTDQMQTRQMLDSHVSELRELLRGEGLVLAGMSIVDAGGNGNGRSPGQAGGQEHKRGHRQSATVQAIAPIAVQTRLPIDGVHGKKLDVFA